MSRMTDRAVTDLPQPDSPTTPSVWARPMSKLTPSTALTVPSSVSNQVRRSLISRTCSPLGFAGAVMAAPLPDDLAGRAGHVTSIFWRGSSASRRPSPRKLAERTMSTRMMPGHTTISGALMK